MWETPNNANPCAFTGAGVPNQNGCADQIIFTGQVPDQTLTTGGITYKLVMKGFSPTTGTCPATQPSNTQTQFLTAEKASSVACLYASLVQVRSLTIVKRIVAPAGITPPSTPFTFDGASTIDGSAWDDNFFTLTPTLANAGSVRASCFRPTPSRSPSGLPPRTSGRSPRSPASTAPAGTSTPPSTSPRAR